MHLLVTGANGQVGHALAGMVAPDLVITALDRAGLDITDRDAVLRAVRVQHPDVVVNAAAYTAVDQAEREPERAFAVNRDGPAHLAEACEEVGIPLLHLSTDYVFDGTKGGAYTEEDPVAPLGVYGQSKWAGEEAVRAQTERHVILRTAWVFSDHGANFVKTMLRLGREREMLRVVADQHGGPTAAADIAAALLAIARQVTADPGRWGTYHFAGQPPTTWYGFAAAIFEEARRYGPLAVHAVTPITTAEYPTPAQRPANSVLATDRIEAAFGASAPDWRASLARTVARLQGA